MKIVYFGNNSVGLDVLKWLREQPDEIVGLVVHPEAKGRRRQDIVEAAGVATSAIFDGSRLKDAGVREKIKALGADLGISVFFGYILDRAMLDVFPKGCVNLHPAYLPFNRGANPNVWSLVEGTPAGATLHHVNEGVDTGDIVAQQRVSVEAFDTGETLYRKLEHACVDLFKTAWPLVRSGKASRTPQNEKQATLHRTQDVARIDEIDLDRPTTARALINLLRARTFPPYDGAFFREEGKKIFLRLQMHRDEGRKEATGVAEEKIGTVHRD